MNEKDPNGLNAHTPGANPDDGKIDFELIERGFARALMDVPGVGTYGCVKYTRDGWMNVPDAIRRCKSAAARHRNAHDRGELYDAKSCSLHKAHEAWNALAQLELIKRELDGS